MEKTGQMIEFEEETGGYAIVTVKVGFAELQFPSEVYVEWLEAELLKTSVKAAAYDRLMSGLNINKSKIFYKNCIKNRKKGCKICDDCPFRAMIEQFEKEGMKELQDGQD